MSSADFHDLMRDVALAIGDRPVDAALADHLNATFPPDGDLFTRVARLVAEGERDGWCCTREAGGIRFGRVVKAGTDCGSFSVDVVRMNDVKGPHHVHPSGEIGMVIPISGDATFDGVGRGWYVYGPGTDHFPTVSGGEAYVVYLLPYGQIEFTGRAA